LLVITAAIFELLVVTVLITPARLGKIFLPCQTGQRWTTSPVAAAILAAVIRFDKVCAGAHFKHLVDCSPFVRFGFFVYTRLLVLSQLGGALVCTRWRKLCLYTRDQATALFKRDDLRLAICVCNALQPCVRNKAICRKQRLHCRVISPLRAPCTCVPKFLHARTSHTFCANQKA
jgi:hypothetical protein